MAIYLIILAYCLLPIAYAKPMPGWMHSAWPGCTLPRLHAFGRRMHSAADAFGGHAPGVAPPPAPGPSAGPPSQKKIS